MVAVERIKFFKAYFSGRAGCMEECWAVQFIVRGIVAVSCSAIPNIEAEITIP